MSHPYTPSATAMTTVTLPDDGDRRKAASVNTPFETLSDAIARLQNFVSGATAFAQHALKLSNTGPAWVDFESARTLTRRGFASVMPALQSDWLLSGGVGSHPFIIGPASTNKQPLAIPGLQDGAVLTSVDLYFMVGTGHGDIPATTPNFDVLRVNSTINTTLAAGTTLGTYVGGPVSGTYANVADYENSGHTQKLTFTCDAGGGVTTLDLSAYAYYVLLQDENGDDSASGNKYLALTATYSVSDLRF